MAHYNTVFSQLLKLIPRHEFETLENSTILVVHSDQRLGGHSL
jgi:hypothetical protein